MKKGFLALLFALGAFICPADAQVTWNAGTSSAGSQLALAYGAGLYVAVGNGGYFAKSPDGLNWTATAATSVAWGSVTYGNGQFVAVTLNHVATSADGTNWTFGTPPNSFFWNSVTYGNGVFVAVSNSGVGASAMSSTDGLNWTNRTANSSNQWGGIVFGNALFVAVSYSGSGSRVMTSTDGISWTPQTAAATRKWTSITYGNGLYVAVANDQVSDSVMASPDGVTWTLGTAASAAAWDFVTYGNGLYVAVATNRITNSVMTSPDGINWTIGTAATSSDAWVAVAYGNGVFVVGSTGIDTMAVGATAISSFAPTAGYTSGGTTVTIKGLYFGGATAVTFGGTSASSFTVNSATQITAVSPAGSAPVAIAVTTPNGSATSSGNFSFVSAATFYSLTGPIGGALNTASTTFTVTPNAPYTGTVTITPSGGGLSTPVVLTFSGSSTAQTFTITPTAAGPVTLTGSNSGGLANPSPLSYATPPAPPIITYAAANNLSISVAFTPGGTGGLPMNYTATCGSKTGTSATSPILVLGLTNGIAVTCTVTATNVYGTSASSAASSSVSPRPNATLYAFTGPSVGAIGAASANFTVSPNGPYTGTIAITKSGGGLSGGTFLTFSSSSIPQTFTITPTTSGPVTLTPTNNRSLPNALTLTYKTLPAPPTINSVSTGYHSLVVDFTAGSSGGSPITGYAATCGSNTTTGSATPLKVSFLTNGTSYSCAVTATTANGTGPASSSLSGTPSAMAAISVYGQGGSFTNNAPNYDGVAADSLKSPVGTALDGSGNLYISDTANNRVLFYPAGSTTATVVYGQSTLTGSASGTSSTSLNSPWFPGLDRGGGLYVSERSNNRVVYFPSGSTTATRVYGQAGSFTTGDSNHGGISASSLSNPTDALVDSGGNVYVTDSSNNRILYFPSGTTTATLVYGQSDLVTNGPGGTADTFDGPVRTALDSGGNLYVSDNSNNRILYYPAGSTTATRVYGQPDFDASAGESSSTGLNSPFGIALDTGGNLYVADQLNNRVLFYPAGSTTATVAWGQPDLDHNDPGTSATALTQPLGVSIDGSGNLYITDTGNNRVLQFLAPVTNYSFTGPTGGGVNAASSNFTVTPNALYTGTITITPSGGGLSTPVVLTFTNSSTPQTFTITATAAGPVTLTPTNNGSLVNGAALTYSTSPSAPTLTSVTAGNGQITVTFTPNATGGSAITGYSATCGSSTVSGSASPITVTGLVNGIGYTCTVTATNASGTSAASGASNPVTPMAPASGYTLSGPSGGAWNVTSTNFTVTPNAAYTGTVTITPSGGGVTAPVTLTFSNSLAPQTFAITPTSVGPVTLTPTNNNLLINAPSLTYSTPPAAPTISSVTAGSLQVSVAFVANQTGGATITSYTATCGTSAIGGSASPIVVTNLSSGTAYTCTVTATNVNGTSASSAASSPVTPFAFATSYAFSGPAGGRLNTASASFTVTPSATFTGTITVTPSGGGLSTPTVLTFTNSSAAQTFTIVPSAVGPVTLTATNSGSLTNAPALTYSTPPAAPTLSSVTAGNGQVSVAFSPNQNGGSAITSFAATCGGSTIAGGSSPMVVPGLTNGTPYSCTVTATNSNGAGAPSTASSPVTPFVPANSFSFSGPAGGLIGTASANFTVAPNALYTGTITITPSGGGLSTATVLTFANSSAPQTLSILPTSVGPVALSSSNNGSLANPPPLAYATQPALPAISSVTAGNGQISVAFAPNATGGSAITGYTATCGSSAIAGNASPVIVTGLANGTAYTCTVTAANTLGTSAASAPSSAATPVTPATSFTLSGPTGGSLGTASSNFTATPNAIFTGSITVTPSGGGLSAPTVLAFSNSAAPQSFTIAPTSVGPVTLTPTNSGSLANPTPLSYSTPPAVPTVVSATPGNAQMSVAFTANANGGSAITGYTATCGTVSAKGGASPIVVTGLTNNTSYTCTVVAVNGVDTSAASAPSSAASPFVPATTYTLTGPAGGAMNTASGIFTITPNAVYTGTISIALPGNGVITPKVLTFSSSAAPQTFTIIPASVGPLTVTATNSGSLINPPALTFATPPAAPLISAATPGNAQVSVSFASNGSGGSPITGYTVNCNGASSYGVTSPIAVIGLTNGVAYTCSVTATNAFGTGASLGASGVVTPVAPATTYSLTGPSGGALNIPSAHFTVTPDAAFSGTITVAASGGGLSTTQSLSFVNSSAPQTFSITPVSVGPVALKATNNDHLKDAAPLSYSTPPDPPVIGIANAGLEAATVAFVPPVNNGGSPVVSYKATCNPGNLSGTGAASPITVNGLIDGTAYTCSVTAVNTVGASTASNVSNFVKPGAPLPPQNVTAVAGDSQATVSFAASAAPGALPITGYSVVVNPGGTSVSTNASPVTVQGLIDGISYTFSVSAQNRIGFSSASLSNAVIPAGLPGAPFTVSASAGDGRAIVSFSAPINTGGRPITGYIALSRPAGIVSTGSGSPITVTGLSNRTPYTFVVAATNSIGTGLPSASSNSVQPLAQSTSSLSLDVSSFPVGFANVEYPLQMLGAKGGNPPYTFSIAFASLPSGLNLAGSQISGVPAWPGYSPFTLSVTDSSGNASSASTSISINPAGADLILSESEVPFSLSAGSQGVPATASVTVRSSDVHRRLSFTAALAQPTPWLTVTGGGSSPGSLQIGLSAAALALAPGMYQAEVNAICVSPSPCAGGMKSITVSLGVTAAVPSLSLTGSILKFDSDSSHVGASAQVAELQNTGGGNVSLSSATAGDSWLSVGKLPSNVSAGYPQPVTVTADSTGLAPGLYTSSVMFASAAGALALPIQLLVSSNPLMQLSPSGSQFRSALGSPLGNPNGSLLVTTATTASIQWQASVVQGANWLTLLTPQGNASSATPGTVAFSVSPSEVASNPPQAYYGIIRITSNDVANSPLDYEVVLEALNSGAPVKPEVVPAGLVFASGAATSQTVRIYASSADPQPFQVSSSTQDGAAWLGVSPLTGSASVNSPGQLLVSVNATGLASGTHRGAVNVAFSGDAVRTIDITLQLAGPSGCDPAAVVATQTSLAQNFQQALGWPVAVKLQLTNGCGSPVTSGTVSASFSNGDQPLVLNPVDSSSGIFSGTWVPGSSSSQVTVTAGTMAPNAALASTRVTGQVTQNAPPFLASNGIFPASSAALGSPLTPGSAIEIYGSNLATGSQFAPAAPLPSAIGGTSVSIGGVFAPLVFVSPNQINAQVPIGLTAGRRYQVEVYVNGALSASQSVDLVPTVPIPPGALAGQR